MFVLLALQGQSLFEDWRAKNLLERGKSILQSRALWQFSIFRGVEIPVHITLPDGHTILTIRGKWLYPYGSLGE